MLAIEIIVASIALLWLLYRLQKRRDPIYLETRTNDYGHIQVKAYRRAFHEWPPAAKRHKNFPNHKQYEHNGVLLAGANARAENADEQVIEAVIQAKTEVAGWMNDQTDIRALEAQMRKALKR